MDNPDTYVARAEAAMDGNNSGIVLALLANASAIDDVRVCLELIYGEMRNACEQLYNIDESLGKLR